MRIAIIAEVFLPKVDGVVNRTVNLVRQLVRRNEDVLVVCPQAEGSRACPVPVVEIPSFPFLIYPEYRIALPDKRLIKELDAFAPDVLHYVNPFAFGFRCYDLLHRSAKRIPSVFSFHTLYGEFVKQYSLLKPLSPLLWWMMREYHNRADLNLTVSRIMQTELQERGFERVKYWPPAVDSRLFDPSRKNSEMRSRLSGGQPEKQLLLTVSRLAPEKNVAFLADVMDHLPNACLAVVGDGPQRAELERRFAGRNASFIGYLKGEELAAAYASAAIFVYASETETMGNVILEAMACGCAVVAPRAGGIPSLVRHAETAMLYAPGSLQEAVLATQTLLSDTDFRTRMQRAARATVEGWDWENSIDSVRNVYRQAIENYHPVPMPMTWNQGLAGMFLSSLVFAFRSVSGMADASARKEALGLAKSPHPAPGTLTAIHTPGPG
ncbi:MAG TPA: glycosyltransferase family 1 protein [Gemmataceae bacterium]|jgi:glycosyltransferase involved in cell wall biosynthesis